MTSSHSQWVWDRIAPLSYLQFPWRFLVFTTVFSSFFGGVFIYFLEKKVGKLQLNLILFVLSILIIYQTYSHFVPDKFLQVDDSYFTNLDKLRWTDSKTSFEYLPKDVAIKLSEIKTTQVDISKNETANAPYKIIKGNLNVKILENKSQKKSFETKNEGILLINTYSFPGWQVFIDNVKTKYNDKNKLKLISIDIPNGNHRIDVLFTDTWPRILGNSVSIISIILLLIFTLKLKKYAKS